MSLRLPGIEVFRPLVNQEGALSDPEKTVAIANFPPQRDQKEVRRFLGLCAYYRRFMQNLSKIAAPRTYLTKADVPFKWEIQKQQAFQQLQRRLQSPPVLAHFDEYSHTEAHTDASNVGLGTVLVQVQKGQQRILAYTSRALSKTEANCSATEKECLTIVRAITKFRPYLYGRPFKVVTDHHALCWLTNIKDPSGRLARWSHRLQEYDIAVTYISGNKHLDADCLSMLPCNLLRMTPDKMTPLSTP